MSLPINESVWLASQWTSHFFVRRNKRIYQWEEKTRLSVIEIDTLDDDEVYEEFDSEFDYKEEWKDAVRFHDYEDSLENYTDYVQQNYRDYIDGVLTGCTDDNIIDWVKENIDNAYWEYNINILSERQIKLREDWEFENTILRNIENDKDDEYNVDGSVFSDILCEFGKLDCKYMEI